MTVLQNDKLFFVKNDHYVCSQNIQTSYLNSFCAHIYYIISYYNIEHIPLHLIDLQSFIFHLFTLRFAKLLTLFDIFSADISVLWKGCMANSWSSIFWEWRRVNTCSAKHSRWLLFYLFWPVGLQWIISVLKVWLELRAVVPLPLPCFVFTHRVTSKPQSIPTLWKCWTLTIIRWLKEGRLRSSRLSWNLRSASLWRIVISSTTQGRPAFRGGLLR